MKEIKQAMKFWPGDIVKDHFGRIYRVMRASVTVDLYESEEPLVSYLCVRATGCYREEEFLERELSMERQRKDYES